MTTEEWALIVCLLWILAFYLGHLVGYQVGIRKGKAQ